MWENDWGLRGLVFRLLGSVSSRGDLVLSCRSRARVTASSRAYTALSPLLPLAARLCSTI